MGWITAIVAAMAIVGGVGSGCGAGGGDGPMAGGAAGMAGTMESAGGGVATLDAPCALDARVGGFAVQLNETALGNPAYTSLSGGVRDGVLPTEVWRQDGASDGSCRLMVGPGNSCTPACVLPQVCGLEGQCIEQPAYQSVGEVTFSGLGSSPITASPLGTTSFYAPPASGLPYPPFAPGAAVGLRAAGATLPGFMLAGQGIEPIAFPGTGLVVVGGQPFAFTWTAPARTGSARIEARLEIGHHGGVAARIVCDLPDSGSGEISATLVSALVAYGIHGFPTFSLNRRTIASTTLAAGCVDFTVASPVERNVIACASAGACVTSCNCGGARNACRGDPADAPCPSGQTCQPDLTCS